MEPPPLKTPRHFQALAGLASALRATPSSKKGVPQLSFACAQVHPSRQPSRLGLQRLQLTQSAHCCPVGTAPSLTPQSLPSSVSASSPTPQNVAARPNVCCPFALRPPVKNSSPEDAPASQRERACERGGRGLELPPPPPLLRACGAAGARGRMVCRSEAGRRAGSASGDFSKSSSALVYAFLS